MDVSQAIKGRRSIRHYRREAIPQDALLHLVEAAVWAPSGGNAQTWRFVILREQRNVEKIKALSPGVMGNPVAFIVICQDKELAEKNGGRIGRDVLSVMDTAMAAENIMLQAFSEGIGSCAILGFDKEGVRKLLHLPEHVVPELAIMLGYPKRIPDAPKRDFATVYFWEEYENRPKRA